MTKTDLVLELLRPAEEELLERIVAAHSLYGLLRLEVEPGGRCLRVTYDGTRWTEQEVLSQLRRLGLPVRLPRPAAAPNPA